MEAEEENRHEVKRRKRRKDSKGNTAPTHIEGKLQERALKNAVAADAACHSQVFLLINCSIRILILEARAAPNDKHIQLAIP